MVSAGEARWGMGREAERGRDIGQVKERAYESNVEQKGEEMNRSGEKRREEEKRREDEEKIGEEETRREYERREGAREEKRREEQRREESRREKDRDGKRRLCVVSSWFLCFFVGSSQEIGEDKSKLIVGSSLVLSVRIDSVSYS